MSASSSIRAVAFDVDGVLVRLRFPEALPRALGTGVEATKPFFKGPFVKCLLGEADLRDELPPYLERWRWDGSLDEFLTFWFTADSNLHQPCIAFVDRLRATGRRCYLASSQEKHRAEYLTNQMGLGRRIDGSFFSCHVGLKKPDPRYFRLIQSSIGVAPHEILFLDDHESNVAAARELGWQAVHFRAGDSLDDIAAEFDLFPEDSSSDITTGGL